MAQTGFTPIQLYSSNTATNVPLAANLGTGELAINITDGKLFYKDNANAIQVIGWKTTPTSAGGTGITSYAAGDIVYYASGTALSKLAIGTTDYVMTSSGSAPKWSSALGITVGTATNIAGGVAGSIPYQTGAGATSLLAIGASGRYLSSSGSVPQWSAPAAFTKTDDTNVTLTLGGSASTALLNAASLTLGWTGTLSTTRGGTGLSSFTSNGIVYASSTSVLATSSELTYNGSSLTLGPTFGSGTIATIGNTGTSGGKTIIFKAPDGSRGVLSYQNTTQTWNVALKGDASQNWYMIANPSETVGVYMTPSASGWNNLSDERAKENWEELSDAVSKIMTLRAGTHTWKKDLTLPRDVGVIAQDVLAVLPEAVSTGDPENFGVRYTHLVPLLIKAIQELKKEINEIKGI
jgi:hypothetical protein